MVARLSTTQAAAYRIGPTANLDAILSRQSTIEHHQARPAASAFRHGRWIYPRQPNRATLTSLGARRLLLPSSIGLNWRDSAFNRRVSPLYSRRSRQAPALSTREVTGANPILRKLLQDQHPQDRAVPVVNHSSALSCLPVRVGFQPNENGLTHEQLSFAPGAKTND